MAIGTDEHILCALHLGGQLGVGLPSFWCVELLQTGKRRVQRQFVVREEHTLQFGAEFPECAGANILSGRVTRHSRFDSFRSEHEGEHGPKIDGRRQGGTELPPLVRLCLVGSAVTRACLQAAGAAAAVAIGVLSFSAHGLRGLVALLPSDP